MAQWQGTWLKIVCVVAASGVPADSWPAPAWWQVKQLLVGQVEELLVLGWVDDGEGLDNITKWGGFHGTLESFSNSGFQHDCRSEGV